MRFGALILGVLGALLGLAAAWFAAGSGAVAPRLVAAAILSCLVGLLGLVRAAQGHRHSASVLLAEAPLGLTLALAHHALVPGALLLTAAALAWLARPAPARRVYSRRRSALRFG